MGFQHVTNLPNATAAENEAATYITSSTANSQDSFETPDGLWLPIVGVWAGDPYGLGASECILNETNDDALRAMADERGIEREFASGFWWVEVLTSEGVVKEDARGLLNEIADALENYPLLDEDAFCAREYEETIEHLDEAIKDELRDAAPGDYDEWDEIADAAGEDLVSLIAAHEELEWETEDCWPRFYSCDVLAIAAHIADTLKESNNNAAAKAAHVEKYGSDPKQTDLFS